MERVLLKYSKFHLTKELLAKAYRIHDLHSDGVGMRFASFSDFLDVHPVENFYYAIDFFLKNQPRSFTIIHKGESKEGARYAIGSLVTNSGQVYRTYFYMKQQGNTAIIQELRFMKE